ncbi:nucleocapsid protein [Alphacytorhabdovirus ribes]|nr:nucleocapsid protein [Black currant cytorhabdovirus 1]
MASANNVQETFQERLQRAKENMAKKKQQSNPLLNKPHIPVVKQPRGTSEFDHLDGISVGKRTSEVWADSHLDYINIYPVKKVAGAEVIALGEAMVKSIMSGTANSNTVDICLVLAVSIGTPAEPTFKNMLDEPDETKGKKLSWATPDSTQLQKTTGLTAMQKRTLDLSRLNLEKETDEEKKKTLAATIKNLEDQEAGIGQTNTVSSRSTADANAYCFIAALLLKLYSKSVESFIKSLESWKTRFAAWYDTSPVKITQFKPTEAQVTSFRLILARRPEIWSTWVWWISYNENQKSLLVTHQGLLNYVACQQFAYTGMHSYSLLVDIHEKTGMTFGALLKQLNCPITRTGVRAAAEIIKNNEVTSKNPTRTTYFRYSRIWNPKYFSALQSSNCVTLLYVTAKVNKMISTQGQGGDPMEIYALKALDETMTNRLDAVATLLAEKIIDHMLIDDQSGEMWEAK